ncbi:MAG: ubiquinone biosynthesis protein UbiD [Candidatus Aenigmarchaeota archaeon ex4484_56]|nr:MAG: ubiquinone biosynthesis protein UbiD [Candidatus Aenigmarchaeota archaeon ex4484_56]
MREYLNNARIIDKPVSTDYELSSLCSKLEDKPTIINLKEYPDVKGVVGLCGNRDSLAGSIGVKKEELIFKLSFEKKGEFRVLEKGAFLENKIENPNILEHIPIPIFYREKNRRYLSSSIVIAKDKETGTQNLSFHRMMYLGKNRFSIRITPRHLHKIFSEEDSLDVIVMIGVHPAIELAAATSYTPDFDELKFAASLTNGLDVVKIKDFFVPANAEIVMYGKITKNLSEEGPFVDLTGTMDIERQQPVFECNTLYFRNNPYFRIIIPGGLEHRILMGVPQEPRIYKIVSNTVPTVKNVCLTEGGCCWLHGVVSIKKKKEGEGKNAIIAALAAHPSMKKVIVVDNDIDIFNPLEVEWALATRFQPDKDIIIIKDARGSSLDPSSDLEKHTTAKWGLDATKPLNKDEKLFKKVNLPLEIDLKNYKIKN